MTTARSYTGPAHSRRAGHRHEDSVFAAAATMGTDEAPPLIGESWRRCVTRYNLDPARSGQPRILTAGELKEQREPLDAFACLAREKIEALYTQVAGAGLVVLLTNTNGVTIEYRGDPAVADDLKTAGLYLGSVWAEEVEGTNGVGTCLATGRPLTVFRDEHFRTRNTGLTCTVTPIRNPFGEVMAVLDVSSMTATTRESQHLAMQLLRAAGRQLERAQIHNMFGQHWKLRLHLPRPLGGASDMLLVVGEDGRIVGADSAAFQAGLVDANDRLIGATLDGLFNDLPNLETVVRAGHRGRPCTGTLKALETEVSLRLRAPEQRGRPPRHRPDPAGAAVPAPDQTGRIAGGSREMTLDELAGDDPALHRQMERLRRVLALPVPILLQGETGSGKEVFARAIHRAAGDDGPLVAVNCAALPESLIESELFGHRPGSFTGARREGASGRILDANGGTLFLDEIGDMPLRLQTRLLRVLSEREVVPVGGTRPQHVDFRLVCATNRDLPALVRAGDFREDLYYRVRGFLLTLPPLRARQDRRTLIAEMLAREAAAAGRPARLDPVALDRLDAYPWPGNLRELRDVLRLALAFSDDDIVGPGDLPPPLGEPGGGALGAGGPPESGPRMGGALAVAADDPSARDPAAVTRAALECEGWCVARAARRMGVSRATLHRRINRFGLIRGRA